MHLPNINLVVVGHKDHGKSTLIGRLLYDSKAIPEQKLREIREEIKKSGREEFEFAYILDSLEEERTGGLTIDIMQSPFRSKKYLYSIIDCPGHKEFIQKMLTGASQADAAILVVSVKEGVEDQTKQHLFLIMTLGIKQLVVAVNKMDAIDYSEKDFKEFSESIQGLLSSLGYKNTPLVPISAFHGDNIIKRSTQMEWYDGKDLLETLDNLITPPQSPTEKSLRCLVQDVYEYEGENVVICKVETGLLRTGQQVIAMPVMETGVVTKIESYGEKVEQAAPGDSVGLIVRGIKNIKRGVVLCGNEALHQTERFVAELIIFSNLRLREEETVSIRIGTAETKCTVKKIVDRIDPVTLSKKGHQDYIEKDEVGIVLFQPLEPLYLEEYSKFPHLGRFVILGTKGAIAAGIVLERQTAETFLPPQTRSTL